MRIIYDYKIFSQPYGGISRYYNSLVTEVLKTGHSANIFAGIHRNNYLNQNSKSRVKGIWLKDFPPKSTFFLEFINQVTSEIYLKSTRPDIVHETYYSSLTHLNTNSIRVTTVYDMIHELYNSNFIKTDKTARLKKASVSRVDHILCISHSTKNDLINILGVDEKKISVVHLGVDIDIFKNKVETKIKKPFILYVGNRNGYKNFDGFIKAFATSNKLKSEFNIIAFGGGKFSINEFQLIRENGYSENQVIQISGGDEKLIELYQHAAAFIYPSKYEGFGLPPLEAMAANCPVISSNTSSMPEVINKAGEFFDPLKIENIRYAIENVVFSEERSRELIRLGNENLNSFSWNKCAEETLEVYEKLL